MEINSIMTILKWMSIFGFWIYLYKSVRKPSEGQKFREEMKFTHQDAERRQTIEQDAHTEHNAESADKVEEDDTKEILTLIASLQLLFRRELEFIRKIRIEVQSEHEKKEGEGLPGGQEIIDLCGNENRLLERIIQTIKRPEAISSRMIHTFRGMSKKLHKITHKVDKTERQAEADHALSNEEEHRIETEDHWGRVFEDKAIAIGTDEKQINDELRNARRKCRRLMDMNKKITDEAETHDSSKDKKIHDLLKMSHQEGKKENLIQEITVALKVAALDEEKVMELLKKSEGVVKKEIAA